MLKSSVKYLILSGVSFAIAIVVVTILVKQNVASTTDPVEAKALFQKKCSECHGLMIVTDKNFNEKKWSTIVDRMVKHGMKLAPGEHRTLVNYLEKNHGT